MRLKNKAQIARENIKTTLELGNARNVRAGT